MNTPRGAVVAIVDDDERALESLGELLEAAGFVVCAYSSATALIHQGGLSGIDCLVSDIGMPDIDGWQLRRLVASQRPELPVILITGRAHASGGDPADVEPGSYFVKPYDGRKLLAAIRAKIAMARGRSS